MAITWSDWLKSKRGRRGDPSFVSLDELASRMGVSRTRVIQIGRLDEPPPYPTRQRIHDALGTTEEELRQLGIIKWAVVRRPGAPMTIPEETPIYPEADSFIATLSPAQRALLRRLLDEADATRPGDEEPGVGGRERRQG